MTEHIPESATIALIAHGELKPTQEMAERLRQFSYLIAVDGGIEYCDAMDLQPDLLIGDFDSADPLILKQFANVERQTYPREKDKTDLEIAIEFAFEEQADSLTVFAALGKRSDHTLYNIALLSRYPEKLVFETDNEHLFVIERQATIPCFPGQTVSLIPVFGKARGVTSKGLKWELNQATIDENFLSVSNIAKENFFSVQVEEGKILVVMVESP